MAEENAPEAEETTASDEAEAPPKKKSGLVKIVILLAVAMVGEAGLFLFLGIGSGDPAEAAAAEEDVPAEADEDADGKDELVEVEVHAFNVTNTKAAPDTIVHIAFKLHALVAMDQQDAFDEAANTQNKARVREAVERIMRSATLDYLEDPSLSTLKRLLREEVNKVLRQSYIVEVAIIDFKTMRQ